MDRLTPHAIAGIACVIVLGLTGSSTLVQAVPCQAGLPLCTAAPNSTCSILTTKQCTTNADCVSGEGTCTIRISGTVTANPNAITTVALMSGSSNVSLTVTGPPLPDALASFFVVPTTAGVDGQATVVATDTALNTCTVPVTFRNRAAVPVVDGEEICHQAAGYRLQLEGSVPPSLSQLGGTTACSSHLATCALNTELPPGLDVLADSRELSIRSPIAGMIIKMKLTRDGSFNANLRLLYKRPIDGAGFHDKTTPPNTSGSTIIRGTGQWSDVRVVCGSPGALPTLSGWGKIFLVLLMLMAMLWSAWRYGPNSNRVSRQP